MSSNKCILFWRTRPTLQTEGVGRSHELSHKIKSDFRFVFTPSDQVNATECIHLYNDTHLFGK